MKIEVKKKSDARGRMRYAYNKVRTCEEAAKTECPKSTEKIRSAQHENENRRGTELR